ncbi:MAG TPA: respiratory nitrate reductase subunit gamma [Azospirillum sp.]|nr:respiratory nitrate reductase subunit gamma [Azospirillum sp.]
MSHAYQFLFGYLPYVALTVFVVGSIIRFDREQYTWRSGSSQILRKKSLYWGSNLFHVGILLLFMGHFFGLLTPPEVYHAFGLSAGAKQLLACIAGGVFGLICFAGLTILLHRRLTDPRIRKNSSNMDIAILGILWVQLVLGLITIPLSLGHLDGSMMLKLADWAQRIVTFRGGAAEQMVDVPFVYRLHLVLGMVIFILFPFSRLVHILSAPVGYLFRSYQIVRTRFRTA